MASVRGRPGHTSTACSHLPLVVTIDSKENAICMLIVMLCCFECQTNYCLPGIMKSNAAVADYASLMNDAIQWTKLSNLSQRVKASLKSSINEQCMLSVCCCF